MRRSLGDLVLDAAQLDGDAVGAVLVIRASSELRVRQSGAPPTRPASHRA
jgi:hypothetical protein